MSSEHHEWLPQLSEDPPGFALQFEKKSGGQPLEWSGNGGGKTKCERGNFNTPPTWCPGEFVPDPL